MNAELVRRARGAGAARGPRRGCARRARPSPPTPTALRSRFPMVGRKVGREPLEAGADPADVHAWTIDDAARTLLLVAAGEAAEGELAELYRYGDAAERRGVLRALPYLDLGDRGLGLSTTRSAPTTRG